MKRKDVSINKVYDARALRVVVGDKNGTLHGPAIQCCYSLLDIVHRYMNMFIYIHYMLAEQLIFVSNSYGMTNY